MKQSILKIITVITLIICPLFGQFKINGTGALKINNVSPARVNFEPESGVAWLDGWAHRGTYTLPATTGDETDFWSRAVIPYDADMQADFDDIRFTDSDGTTLLYQDKFTYTTSTAGTFCFTVPSKPAAGQLVYVYWGNDGAADVSDKDNVYQFYDDFTGANGDAPNPAKWTRNPQIVINNNQLRIPLYNGEYVYSNSEFAKESNWGIMLRAKTDRDYAMYPFQHYCFALMSSYSEAYEIGGGFRQWRAGELINTASTIYNVYGVIEIRQQGSVCDTYFDGTKVQDNMLTNHSTGNNYTVRFYMSSSGDDTQFAYIDYVYVFKLPTDGTEISDYGVPDSE